MLKFLAGLVEYIRPIRERIQLATECTRGNHVVGVAREKVVEFNLLFGVFWSIQQRVARLECTFSNQFEHATHFATGECRTENRTHFTPLLAAHQKESVAHDSIHVRFDDEFVVLERIKVFDGNSLEQLRVTYEEHWTHQMEESRYPTKRQYY